MAETVILPAAPAPSPPCGMALSEDALGLLLGALASRAGPVPKYRYPSAGTLYPVQSHVVLRAPLGTLPAGTFTFNLPPPNVLEVLSPAYTLTELTDHINAALLKQNWLLVRNDRSFAVIPADEKVDPKFVTHSSREKLNAHGRYALVAVTIQFGKSDAEELVAGVHKKLTPFGELIRLPRSGGIIIRDLAGNLREIVKTYPGLLTVDPEAKP
ncbi:MAG: hypothetical protein J0H19_00115 [Rhodospirillales bacterium]|nr:hypothetical protein [Rhodospirillales bacterium]